MVIRLLLILIPILIGIIPYWTGIKVEQEFTKTTKKLYQSNGLKVLQTDYQRGWFNSYASSVVQTNTQNFDVDHKINHGLMPLIKTSIHTIVQIDDKILLDVLTKIKINGDNTSVLNTPTSQIKNYKWQNLQGHISANRQLTDIKTTLNSSLLSNGHIKAQNISLQLNINDGIGSGDLKIANMTGAGLQLETIKLDGQGQIQADNLMLAIKTKIEKVGNYGSSNGYIELTNWHLPSLLQMVSTYGKEITLNRMIQGMELLEHSPKLSITNFELDTLEGLIHGDLQIKMQPLENPLSVLFNPNPLLKLFNVQLAAYIPKPFLSTSTQLKAWVKKGILVENNTNYYQTQIVLDNGLLQVNGKQSALSAILQ
ncbi:DUF945 family protein [Candidatus Halobeggiatoa sp. HSG11]|nr:DUF945 family protein [Candidatus Halobeggiatoa sp. HSG11]